MRKLLYTFSILWGLSLCISSCYDESNLEGFSSDFYIQEDGMNAMRKKEKVIYITGEKKGRLNSDDCIGNLKCKVEFNGYSIRISFEGRMPDAETVLKDNKTGAIIYEYGKRVVDEHFTIIIRRSESNSYTLTVESPNEVLKCIIDNS